MRSQDFSTIAQSTNQKHTSTLINQSGVVKPHSLRCEATLINYQASGQLIIEYPANAID